MYIRKVQTYLDHRSMRSTQRCTDLSNSEVARDMKIKLEELFRERQYLLLSLFIIFNPHFFHLIILKSVV